MDSPEYDQSGAGMNYRHHFHAGNFADVMKHALLVRLVRALQKKGKGFLCLDSHAARGRYDLTRAAAGDSLARRPEWPEGIGRLWSSTNSAPAGVREYLELVRSFDRRQGNLDSAPRFYPGSPWILRLLARSVDRMALCEKHPAEYEALRAEFGGMPRVSVHAMDGYEALRAMLPPPERRALVLIDPPYEAEDEYARIATALQEGWRRLASGVFAVWYPLTLRARVEEFFGTLRALDPPPTLAIELAIAGPASHLKMKGCGLLILNPPWKFEQEAGPIVGHLAEVLAQERDGGSRIEWVVRERGQSQKP
jgi:23S rRNA (adenine2030-N6)-methyltransferase